MALATTASVSLSKTAEVNAACSGAVTTSDVSARIQGDGFPEHGRGHGVTVDRKRRIGWPRRNQERDGRDPTSQRFAFGRQLSAKILAGARGEIVRSFVIDQRLDEQALLLFAIGKMEPQAARLFDRDGVAQFKPPRPNPRRLGRPRFREEGARRERFPAETGSAASGDVTTSSARIQAGDLSS